MTAGATAAAVSDPWMAAEYPSRRDEAWRYAPHGVLDRLSFGPRSAPATGLPSAVRDQIPALDGPRIVLVNGVRDDVESDDAALSDGLRLSTLADAPKAAAELMAAHVDPDPDAGVAVAGDAFAAIGEAFGVDGCFIDVAGGHQLDTPIHIVQAVIHADAPNTSCTGVVIHVGEGSSATVVETRLGSGTGLGGVDTRTTIVLEADATLDHILLQDMPGTQVHIGRVVVTQRAGSTMRARSFNLGAAYGRVAYDVHLAGPGAHADLSGLYFGSGDQTLDQQITVIHGAEDCTSRQTFRGVLDDESTGVFNGGIDVRPGADGTDAQQANDNLLLSTRAEANTQPRLEILADDVVCKHGATVGRLDDAALYYLRSRGIPAPEARRLLVDAFAGQTVDDVGIDVVRAWIRSRLGGEHA